MRISDLVAMNARRYTNKTAIIFKGRRQTFDEYNDRVNKTVHALRRAGCEAGDRIAVLSDGNAECVELFFAVARGGFIIVPLNYRLTPAELAHIINDSSAKVLIVKLDFLEKILPVRERLTTIKGFLCLGGESGDFKNYERLVESCPADHVESETADNDPVWLLYTSGTTGLPKAVMLTQKGLGAVAATVPMAFEGMGRDDVGLLCTPPYALSFSSPILGHWFTGSSIVLLEKFDALQVLNAVQEHRVTVFMAVPTMLKMMIEHPDFSATT